MFYLLFPHFLWVFPPFPLVFVAVSYYRSYPLWNALQNLCCDLNLRLLAFYCCFVRLYDVRSSVQSDHYWKKNWWQLTDLQNLKIRRKIWWLEKLPMSPFPRCTACCNLKGFWFVLGLMKMEIAYSQHSQSWWLRTAGMLMNWKYWHLLHYT